MTAANQDETRKQIGGQRRAESLDGDAVPMGYEDGAGQPRSVPGDDEGPWLKTPPFPSQVTRWYTGVTGEGAPDRLPLDSYFFTDPLDVRQRRTLSIWIAFTAGDVDAGLSIIPQIFNDVDAENSGAGANEYWNTTVLDPTISVIDLSGTSVAVPSVGSRTFYAAELRTTVLPVDSVERIMLPFDVAPISRFRLAVGVFGAEGANGSLVLGYSFNE